MNPDNNLINTFQISPIPREIKHLILDYLDVADALKLLKVNHDLRNQILFKGPFPKKVNEINIELSAVAFTQRKRNFAIEVITEKENYDFYLSDETIFDDWRTVANVGRLSIVGHLNGFNTINLIRSCRSLKINLRSLTRQEESHMDELVEALFENYPFLPYLHTIATFSLISAAPRAKLLFENFRPRVTKYAKIEIPDPNHAELTQVIRNNFTHCPLFLSDDVQKDWDFLSNTKAEVLFFHCRSINSFLENGIFLLEAGIPSKFEKSAAILWMDEPCQYENDLLQNVFQRLYQAGNFLEIEENSKAFALFLDSFGSSFLEKHGPLDWPPFKSDHFLNLNFTQKRLFRRMMNNKLYVYLIGKVEKREITSVPGVEFNFSFPQMMIRVFDIDFLDTLLSWKQSNLATDLTQSKKLSPISRRGSFDREATGGMRRFVGTRFRSEL